MWYGDIWRLRSLIKPNYNQVTRLFPVSSNLLPWERPSPPHLAFHLGSGTSCPCRFLAFSGIQSFFKLWKKSVNNFLGAQVRRAKPGKNGP